MPENPKFIHLRVHSEYSLLEGAVRLKKLPDLVGGHGHAGRCRDRYQQYVLRPGVFGSGAKAGIQPIIGCQVDLAYDPAPATEKPRAPAALVLLAQNERGL